VTRQEFLSKLEKRLLEIPKQNRDEILELYGEMIDDRIEEGLTEEAAVCNIGNVDEIAEQIIADVSSVKAFETRTKPKKRLRAWHIVLLVLGSPVWIPLAVAAFVVALSLYGVLWSLVSVVWVVFVTLAACAVGGIISGTIFIVRGLGASGIAMIGASLACAGLAIFSFIGGKASGVGVVRLTRATVSGIKKCFVGKEKSYEQEN
jgi:uncharacterized membrane protein